MRNIFLITAAVMATMALLAWGQSAGDYRSAASGNWNAVATWEYYNGSAWVPASATPTSASGAITIRSGHTVTATANVTVDQVVVEAGGQITVNATRTLTIDNGPGVDLICHGTLWNSGTVTVNESMSINDGGTYQHARNGSKIPTAAWETGSTCLVTGITNTVPRGLGQSFYNFTWNCTGQGTNQIDADQLSIINGHLTVISTGTTGRLNNSSGDLTVLGNYQQTGGTFNPGRGSGTVQRFFLGGDFNQTGGTFRNNTGGGQLIVVFNGTNQTFNAAGTLQNAIDFHIRPGSILTLLSNLPLNINTNTNDTGTVRDSGTLYTGGYAVTGAGKFILPGGGTLGIGSTEGITTLGTDAGSIRTTGGREYSSQGNYIYNGSTSQVTGSGLPSTVNDLTIDNNQSVTLTNQCTVNNRLSLDNGILHTGSNRATISAGGSCLRTNGWVNGNLAKVIGIGPQAKTFEVGTANGYSPVEVSFANVTASGTLTAKAVQNVHPNVFLPANCLKRYWSLTNSGITFDQYSATFHYLADDFNLNFVEASDEADMVVGKYGPWSLPTISARNTGGPNDGGSIQVSGLTGFSDFTLAKDGGSLDNALAVVLSSLAALATGEGIALSWRTESETGSYLWLVERAYSANGPYAEMARLPAAGNSATPRDYAWTDNSCQPGATYYYRLGELGLDGRTTYFGPVSASWGGQAITADMSLGCVPNPFRSTTDIRYQVSQEAQVSIAIYNVAGQMVSKLDQGMQKTGFYRVPWDGTNQAGVKLSAGIYLYRIHISDKQFTGRVHIVR